MLFMIKWVVYNAERRMEEECITLIYIGNSKDTWKFNGKRKKNLKGEWLQTGYLWMLWCLSTTESTNGAYPLQKGCTCLYCTCIVLANWFIYQLFFEENNFEISSLFNNITAHSAKIIEDRFNKPSVEQIYIRMTELNYCQ